jgi:hypothetical protein
MAMSAVLVALHDGRDDHHRLSGAGRKMADDDGSRDLLQGAGQGHAVVASDGTTVGTVREVLENEREHIFDGLFVDTPAGSAGSTRPESRGSPSGA